MGETFFSDEFLEIEICVLKVHMNCQGCMNKVKKVLKKIEGVYKVDINAEEQKVTVTGVVDPSTLVQELAKFGKHAEIWNAGYSDSEDQCKINDPSASENSSVIPTYFGKDHWGPQDMSFKTMESRNNQHYVEPLFLENVNNRTNHNFPIAKTHGYYHHYHPSNMMQLSSNHLPWAIHIQMGDTPTCNDKTMNAYMHH
ncbi:hypothetical protein RJT34_19993 [Clitoria ternatea]|uniref:HMA domain-containing protein n=1 Tax=Clitoria ternatea TaxID=43366 RepID=A0AAN9P597_CLITE